MVQEPQLTPNDPDAICRDIARTRSSLTEKLDTLGCGVRQTVQTATSAIVETVETVRDTVESTVDTVKQNVHGTVQSVKETLDVKHQVMQHPWPMIGGAVVAGFLAGTVLPSHRSLEHWAQHRGGNGFVPREDAMRFQAEEPRPYAGRPLGGLPAREGPGFWASLATTFAPEIDQLKRLAIGATLSYVRDIVKDSLPESLVPQVDSIVEGLTSKLGGEPVSGRVA